VLASLSPLLTFAALFQQKEWRLDRLREHLRSEGWLTQLAGKSRLILLGILCCTGLLLFLYVRFSYIPSLNEQIDDPAFDPQLSLALGMVMAGAFVLLWIGSFAALSMLQIILRKQRFPKWTQKALLIVLCALLLDAFLLLAIPETHLLLPLTQAPVVFVVWLLLKPLDAFLKERILAKAARLRASFSHLTVIGITGSVGKTTTKELLQHVLKQKNPLVTPEHVNSEMGVAQWLLKELPKLDANEPRIMIVEMGAYRAGEIALLCEIAKPSLGVLTYIGTQHLALFGSQQKLMETKGELLQALPSDGHAFINGDSDLCREIAKTAPCPVTIVGTGGHLDMEAFDIEEKSDGVRFRIKEENISLPLHGTHQVTNVLLAIAVAEHLGMDLASIARALKSFAPLKRTFEVRIEHGVTILDDTHNASAASFCAAIEWARAQPADKKYLVTSGLIELGEEQERTHERLGADSAGIFEETYFLSAKSAKAFERGLGKPVRILTKNHIPMLPKNSLLICIGLVPPSIIQKFLPKS